MEKRGLSAYLAELVGTFLLVLFVVLIVSVYARGGISTPEFAVIGLLHAFVLMMLISTLGGVSGAHFNPAVTLGLAAARERRLGRLGHRRDARLRRARVRTPDRRRPEPGALARAGDSRRRIHRRL